MSFSEKPKHSLEDVMDLIGFGRYNAYMLVVCCLLILAMYHDIFGFSVVMPVVACDLELNTTQQGLLSAVPLIGVMISSYAWGLCADTMGRRSTLMVAMPLGIALNIAATFAPTYTTLVTLKFLSAGFTSSANAAGFVLMGESVPRCHRSRVMFLMASATLFVQFFICLFALPVIRLTFQVPISWLSLEYRPWRLLMLIITLPGLMGIIGMVFLHESPKYLLSKSRDNEAVNVLRSMYTFNTGAEKESFPVNAVYLDEPVQVSNGETSFIRKVWNQTAPLFKPPLLKNSMKLYYLLLCAYMTSTGYTMWIPTMTNAYFNGDDKSGQTFCDVASTAAFNINNSTTSDCDNAIKHVTLYAVMFQSGVAGVSTILLSFVVGSIGKRRMTILVFTMSATCGLALLFVTIPLLSIALFYMFLYVSFILGNVNTYLVELNPTHLRGMATSLSVVVARGFGFFSVQLIAELLTDHCSPMITGYVVLIMSGLLVSMFLPDDEKKSDESTPQHQTISSIGNQKTRL